MVRKNPVLSARHCGIFSEFVKQISMKNITVAQVAISEREFNIQIFFVYFALPAFPIPKSTWKKDGEVLEGARVLRKSDDKKATLKIEKCQRGDKGKYELLLSNSKGETRVPIEIEVIDKPGAPEGPLKVSDVTNTTAVLAWKPPRDDGGSPIEHYVVEKMDVARGEWSLVETVSHLVNQLKIGKLTPKKEYKFRVRALNKEGESPNLEMSESFIAKNPFDEPSAPGQPDIVNWDSDNIEIAWREPSSDGGAPIEKYVVEKREKGSKGPWSKGAECNAQTCKAIVHGLSEGKEYEFRVCAINKGGPSEPSETSKAQIAKPRFRTRHFCCQSFFFFTSLN